MSTTAKIKEQVLITGMIRFQYLWRIATCGNDGTFLNENFTVTSETTDHSRILMHSHASS